MIMNLVRIRILDQSVLPLSVVNEIKVGTLVPVQILWVNREEVESILEQEG